MSKDGVAEDTKPQRISLQVPKNVDLAKMSDAEISRLALDMSRKMAAALPGGTVLTGVEGVTLSQNKPGIGVEVGWSRACGRAELSREGLVVNPEVFSSPIRAEDIVGKSARISIQTTPIEPAKKKKS